MHSSTDLRTQETGYISNVSWVLSAIFLIVSFFIYFSELRYQQPNFVIANILWPTTLIVVGPLAVVGHLVVYARRRSIANVLGVIVLVIALVPLIAL